MSKYLPVDKMPNLTISFRGLQLLGAIQDEDQRKVIDAVLKYAEAVRIEDCQEIPEKPELSVVAGIAYDELTESINTGAKKYWVIVKRNRENAQKPANPAVTEPAATERPTAFKLEDAGLTSDELKKVKRLIEAGKITNVQAYCDQIKKNRPLAQKYEQRDYSSEEESLEDMVNRLEKG